MVWSRRTDRRLLMFLFGTALTGRISKSFFGSPTVAFLSTSRYSTRSMSQKCPRTRAGHICNARSSVGAARRPMAWTVFKTCGFERSTSRVIHASNRWRLPTIGPSTGRPATSLVHTRNSSSHCRTNTSSMVAAAEMARHHHRYFAGAGDNSRVSQPWLRIHAAAG